jgi:NADH dehydrogenase
MAMPTVSRKFRIFSGWVINLFVPRDVTPMTATETPRKAFVRSIEETTKPDDKDSKPDQHEQKPDEHTETHEQPIPRSES